MCTGWCEIDEHCKEGLHCEWDLGAYAPRGTKVSTEGYCVADGKRGAGAKCTWNSDCFNDHCGADSDNQKSFVCCKSNHFVQEPTQMQYGRPGQKASAYSVGVGVGYGRVCTGLNLPKGSPCMINEQCESGHCDAEPEEWIRVGKMFCHPNEAEKKAETKAQKKIQKKLADAGFGSPGIGTAL